MAKIPQDFSAAEMRADFMTFKERFNATGVLCFNTADTHADSYYFSLRIYVPWFHNLSGTDLRIDSSEIYLSFHGH